MTELLEWFLISLLDEVSAAALSIGHFLAKCSREVGHTDGYTFITVTRKEDKND